MMNVPHRFLGVVCAVLLTAVACGGSQPSTPGSSDAAAAPAAGTPAEAEAPLPPSDLDTQLPPAVREAVLKSFTGDFDQMIERKVVRVGVVFNRTFYFVDKGV